MFDAQQRRQQAEEDADAEQPPTDDEDKDKQGGLKGGSCFKFFLSEVRMGLPLAAEPGRREATRGGCGRSKPREPGATSENQEATPPTEALQW